VLRLKSNSLFGETGEDVRRHAQHSQTESRLKCAASKAYEVLSGAHTQRAQFVNYRERSRSLEKNRIAASAVKDRHSTVLPPQRLNERYLLESGRYG
jgi:hypothetical protein